MHARFWKSMQLMYVFNLLLFSEKQLFIEHLTTNLSICTSIVSSNRTCCVANMLFVNQVDFLGLVHVVGVVLQSRSSVLWEQWVTEYRILASRDCSSWEYVVDKEGLIEVLFVLILRFFLIEEVIMPEVYFVLKTTYCWK